MSTRERIPTLLQLCGRRILIAEDQIIERELLASYLRRQGCRVYLAENGVDAIEKTRRFQPDLVLMDVRMPVRDGLSACRILKTNALTQAIKIIFLTGASTPDDRVQGLLAGAVDYIVKPFNFDEVGLRLALHLQAADQKAPTDSGAQTPNSGFDHLTFHAARAHLLKHIDGTPDLQQLARATGTNVSRLNKSFKHCVGMTVFEYLREERMKEGRKLLAETGMTIQSIALELGFTSGANFTAAFKSRFGLTPTQFRNHRGRKPQTVEWVSP